MQDFSRTDSWGLSSEGTFIFGFIVLGFSFKEAVSFFWPGEDEKCWAMFV